MSPLRTTYFLLAVAGTALPLWQMAPELAQAELPALWSALRSGAGWRAFLDLHYVTLRWEALIPALTLTVWILAEVSVRRNWSALWALPATWLFGVGSGLPLYLFLRTRPIT